MDNCIQLLLKWKDNNCLDMPRVRSAVLEVMNKLPRDIGLKNIMTNTDSAMESMGSDEEILAESLPFSTMSSGYT